MSDEELSVTHPFGAPGTEGAPAEGDPVDEAAEGERLLEHFAARLRGLKATEDEIERVRSTWNDLDDDWTVERRRFVALDWPDEQLARDLIASRREDARSVDEQMRAEARTVDGQPRLDGSGTSDLPDVDDEAPADVSPEHHAADAADSLAAVVQQLQDEKASIPAVMEWVGEDVERARVMLDSEHAKGEEARTSLITKLEALTGEGG